MDRFRLHGPSRLVGTIAASGAKNAALPALAVAILTDQPVVLAAVPRVRDLATMRRLLQHLGVEITDHGDGGLTLRTVDHQPLDAPYDLVKTMRAGVLVLGPLLARRGEALVSMPGGCAIGVRPIDQHLAGLEALGADVRLDHGYVHVRADRLLGARFRFAKETVTGTENVLMAASLARGTTVLENCAREPEVVDLVRLLTAMGARIDGAGTSTLTIEGVDALGGARHRVIADRIEGGTYLIGGALTGGDVTLAGADAADLGALLEALVACGAEVAVGPEGIRVRAAGELVAHDVTTAPYPGFPTDLQAQWMVLMTQAHGLSTIAETVFENRFQHVPELARMGATIELDGHYAHVRGRTPLAGANVMATDLRASASLVLAGLVADGETTVDRIYHLDRGYEAMEQKLAQLGARVERIGGGAVAQSSSPGVPSSPPPPPPPPPPPATEPPMSTDCIFCRIGAGEVPAQVVFEDTEIVGFRDLAPQAPVHVLLIPRRHLSSVAVAAEADGGLLGRLLLAAATVARQLGIEPGGYRVVTNAGRDGGQSVAHLHLHLLGGRALGWPPG